MKKKYLLKINSAYEACTLYNKLFEGRNWKNVTEILNYVYFEKQ